ncbi:MAG: putative bifunctional diguanylate cyclase/phosphodiesterase [Paracoccaceae bacterium]
MFLSPRGRLVLARLQLKALLLAPPMLAFLPALTLGAFWFGGEETLIAVSLGLPLIFAFCGAFQKQSGALANAHDALTGLLTRHGFELQVTNIFERTAGNDLKSACFLLEIDDLREISARHGQKSADLVRTRVGDRILSTMRDQDTIGRIGDSRFGVCLSDVSQLDLELCIQMSGRLQTAIEEPISLDGISLYISCSIGFCLRARAPGTTPSSWIEAAESGLTEALRNGPSSIRAFSPEIQAKAETHSHLREEATRALENGQIQPWFQPQISTDTGKVTGFEVLARWQHPVQGVIPPEKFLPALNEAGLLERLSQVMLYHALTALKAWDNAGIDVPQVGVNFATDELRNPGLVDRIRWELDRFDLTPERLSVEILESVVSDGPDDIITRNINELSQLGCRVELDDFGTGNASILAIRRFRVSRIKIDRSFVTKADQDPEQQRLVAAILTMAERLELDTLAEGVETVGEHALLAQLGCDHVQGFGIGKPMPFEQTLDWVAQHQAKLKQTPQIGQQSS